MKKLLKRFFLLAMALVVSLGAVACGKDEDKSNDNNEDKTQDNGGNTGSENQGGNGGNTGSENQGGNGGNTGSENQGGNTDVPSVPTPVVKPSFTEENYAHGAVSYVAASYEKRAEILGILEAYAVKNNLTGLTLFENGSYAMYHEDVVKGTDVYIPGYGFGILSEGYLSAPLESETNPDWQWYWHSLSASDPKTMNYMNDKGSEVSDLNGYSSSSYWGTKMNETKDGYEWFPVQSNSDRPIPVDGVQTGDQILAKKYRFELKVGAEYKYNTNSQVPAIAAFDGREVALEDYLTAYKMLWTKAYGMARATDNLEGSGAIKGSLEYYEASVAGLSEDELNALFDELVGIKTEVIDGKSWMEVEFTTPCNQFYAMYYLSSGLSTPVPADYIRTLGNGSFAEGMKVYGNMTDGGWTPVDTYLSTGAYTLERWDADQQIVYKRNPYYDIEGFDRYQIAGVHIRILKAMGTDPVASHDQFLAGNTHSSGIPLQRLQEYKEDPRTTRTTGSSTFKLNFNSCTQEEWNELFGVNGTITKTEESKYWKCEPAMSNDNFLRGLSYALNREELATVNGLTPCVDYFSGIYLSNPEDGISYNSTEYHKNAIAHLTEGTKVGYNLEYAKASFQKAAQELIAAGHYKAGDTIEIEITWMYPTDREEMHNYIETYFETAFNSADTGLTLDVVFDVGALWSDVYYNKMMIGQFDIGFGSINGNSLNPLNFLEVLRSDNSSGFTLNWGCDTSVVSEDIFYDGMYWSFDSLWIAADQGGYFEKGQLAPFFSTEDIAADDITVNDDGTWTIAVDYSMGEVDGLTFEIDKAVVFAYNAADNADGYAYVEEVCAFSIDEANHKLVATLTADQVAKYVNASICKPLGLTFDFGVDFYYTAEANGVDLSGYNSVVGDKLAE